MFNNRESHSKVRPCKLLGTSESMAVFSPSKLHGDFGGCSETRCYEHYTRFVIEIK
ncbi:MULTISPECIES: hypothetical protein [Methanosarcina]|uniref:hypothetical protein n=1 Tax=Methanosarcina TaxID=2207 RepID=UPI0012D40333|nr:MULTISPECIES: hypothetical protein [Methanosarcina]